MRMLQFRLCIGISFFCFKCKSQIPPHKTISSWPCIYTLRWKWKAGKVGKFLRTFKSLKSAPWFLFWLPPLPQIGDRELQEKGRTWINTLKGFFQGRSKWGLRLSSGYGWTFWVLESLKVQYQFMRWHFLKKRKINLRLKGFTGFSLWFRFRVSSKFLLALTSYHW